MANVDRVPLLLRDLNVANVDVEAMLDSSLWLDVPPHLGGIIPLQNQTQATPARPLCRCTDRTARPLSHLKRLNLSP